MANLKDKSQISNLPINFHELGADWFPQNLQKMAQTPQTPFNYICIPKYETKLGKVHNSLCTTKRILKQSFKLSKNYLIKRS